MFATTGTNQYYIVLDVPQPSPAQLLCCRACLTTDGRLFNIHDFKLADAFSYTSGSLAVKDQLPQYLCSFCRGLVLKCATFRDMCARTQELLMTELLTGQLNTESVRRINQTSNRFLNLTLTEVETIDCVPSIIKTASADDIQDIDTTLEQDINVELPRVDDINGVELPLVDDINDVELPLVDNINDVELPLVDHINIVERPQLEYINDIELSLVEDIKDEASINIVDINSILQKTGEINEIVDKLDKSKIPVKSKCIKKEEKKTQTKRRTTKDKTETKLNIENKSVFKNVVNISSLKHVTNDIDNLDENEVEYDDSISQGDESNLGIEDDHKINDDKQNINGPVKKQKRNVNERETNVAKKNKKKVNNRGKTKFNLVQALEFGNQVRKMEKERKEKELLEFQSEHSVQIVLLSKEEQLAEVAARKETLNYKESDYKCQECYKGYDDKAAYENHMLRHNPSMGPYMCEICKVRFRKNSARLTHQNRHGMKILCTKCDFVSRTKGQAKNHHCLHAGKTFDCPHCGKSFAKRTTCLSHTRLAHPALNVTCDECGEVFVGASGLRQHRAKVHSEKIRCTICSAKFVSLAALDRHTDTAGEHKDLWPCEQCGENCASEAALQEHVRKKHPKDHRCEECSLAFRSADAYTTHVARTHLDQRKTDYGRQSPSKRKRALMLALARAPSSPHMCEQCGRIFSNGTLLSVHQRTHDTEKRYSCHYCSKAFRLKTILIVHLRSHTGEKPFKCPSCPRTFNQPGNLNRHNKTAHLGVRNSFMCAICGSTTSTKSSLRVHIDSKHGGKGWPKSRKRTKCETSTK